MKTNVELKRFVHKVTFEPYLEFSGKLYFEQLDEEQVDKIEKLRDMLTKIVEEYSK
jgi:hypothetical protein